ncbi:MAG: hypothetical protein RMJ39_09560 [Deltaproteobacteria bacterium]|nr:hypothetical protein [Deltaproteobacteria bacterium]
MTDHGAHIKLTQVEAFEYRRPFTKDPKKVARDFEALFLSLILKEMKKTISFSRKSLADSTYWDILFDKVSEYLAQRGIGLKNLFMTYLETEESKKFLKNADKKVKGVESYEGE